MKSEAPTLRVKPNAGPGNGACIAPLDLTNNGLTRAALRGKRIRPPGSVFLADFEKEVFALHEELWAGTYQHGAYNYFNIYEPKERVVAAAPFRDRVVHQAVVRVIEPIFEKRFIEDSFACRLGKGTHAAMRRAAQFSRRFRYALKCDVRKYFPSMDHDVLIGLLRRVINGLYMARSSMMAIMCTWCSYTGQTITWQQAMNSKHELKPDRYSLDATPPTKPGPDGNYPIPVPGVTKFV